MTILGINSYTHDVSVVLIAEGEPILMLEEERLSRQRHHDGIIFGGTPPRQAIAEVLDSFTPDMICHSRAIDHSARSQNLPQKAFLEFAKELDPGLRNTRFCNHHLCHAASAFYCSGFQDAYVCTLDSRGDGLSCTVSIGKNQKIEKFVEIPARTSLCAIYSFTTELLGLGRRREGSLMGLAAYGRNPDLFPDLCKWTGYSFAIKGLSLLEKVAKESYEFEHKANVALSMQACFERAIVEMLQDVCSDKAIRKLALAGGGFLNCILTHKLSESNRWDDIFITPAAGDSGTALGAALLCLQEPQKFSFPHAFWGSAYTEAEVKDIIEECNLKARKASAGEVARLIADGQVGAIFDGAMEYGPRALGHRSIVGDPRKKKTALRLNVIKRRQWWRPVAPAILDGEGHNWFHNYTYTPFMNRAFTAKDEAKDIIPAVIHEDNTSRLQSVNQDVGFLYDLLVAFNAITSVPLLANTSFNVQTPIVRTPKEAVSTFFTSGLDFLHCQGWLFQK